MSKFKPNPASLLLNIYLVFFITCLVSFNAHPYKANLNDITWSMSKDYVTLEDYEVDKSGDKFIEEITEKVIY